MDQQVREAIPVVEVYRSDKIKFGASLLTGFLSPLAAAIVGNNLQFPTGAGPITLVVISMLLGAASVIVTMTSSNAVQAGAQRFVGEATRQLAQHQVDSIKSAVEAKEG